MSKKSSNKQALIDMSLSDKRVSPVQSFIENVEGVKEAIADFRELRESGYPVTYKHLHKLLTEKYGFKWGVSVLKGYAAPERDK